jgi:lysophospholipid acyltransferase (LPLAT)-like uncharacterized protein
VIPHKPTWIQRAAARLIWGLVHGISATTRFRLQDPLGTLGLIVNRPVIMCIWHNRLVFSLIAYERFVRGISPNRKLSALVSASRDGAMLTRVLELFDVEPVRGSSSRRGAQALLELTTCIERGLDVAITPDGPRGPCYHAQEGVIAMAQLTGLPVVPTSINVSRKVSTRSWDRFQIPLPFGIAELVVGGILRVPREAGAEEREALRKELEIQLRALSLD